MTAEPRPSSTALDFDPSALREKYQRERDKRLRPDGDDQYLEVSGKFAHFTADPYVDARFARAPLSDEVEVLIIGGGFSGMLAAARLKEAGISGIRIVESGGDFGGTWYWNRYPGAQCDIESYCYLPLLEETAYMPKEKYSFSPEIYAHSQRIAKHFGLYELACFRTHVQSIRWDDASARWTVVTDRGDRMRAHYVIVATGPASRPKLPGIPGIQEFEGHTFHTSRWDYAYTGGDHGGNLHKLADKRVAIIGTGATAIQCVPFLGAHAKQLFVFQRTPSSVDFRGNKPTDPAWAKTLRPGWQRARRENFNDVVTGRPFEVDLVSDAWTDIFRNLASNSPVSAEKENALEQAAELAEIADFQKMNQIRARVDAEVRDKAAAEALKPWYRQFCKRPTFNDDYLATFNRPNVKLIDVSDTRGVERITKKGLVAGGVEYEVDCIIFSTGFEIGTAPRRRIGFEIFGSGGQSLYDYWKDGLRTLHGFSVHGFPNWFFIGISQNGVSVNMTSMFDDQAKHVAYVIRETQRRGAQSVQPSAEGEAEWVRTIRSLASMNTAFAESCTPGYYNSEGKFAETPGTFTAESYAPGANAFNALLAEWRARGDLAGLELK